MITINILLWHVFIGLLLSLILVLFLITIIFIVTIKN